MIDQQEDWVYYMDTIRNHNWYKGFRLDLLLKGMMPAY